MRQRRKERALDDLALLYGPGIGEPLGVVKMCDLAMDHADNGIPSDSPYHAPDHDGA